jgi:hypothetical protein
LTPFLTFCLAWLPLALWGSASIVGMKEFQRAAPLLIAGVVLIAVATAFVTTALPFGEGGDDSLYFNSTQFARRNGDMFDTTRFLGTVEQPGFPLLLSLATLIANDSLLSFKFLNLLLLVLTAAAWGRIASRLATPRFGVVVMIAVLLTAPLWTYVFFLLKDMSIVFLQSLFVLGLVEIWTGRKLWPWALIAAATFALIFFRTPLVVQNAIVTVAALGLRTFARRGAGQTVVGWGMAAVMLVGLMVVVTNPELLNRLGVGGSMRVIGSQEMYEHVDVYAELRNVSPLLFPVIYVFTETSGFAPETWAAWREAGIAGLGASGLRGLLAVPWILAVVPFFFVGARWLLSSPAPADRPGGILNGLARSRLATTGWGVVVLFLASSLAISWMVGDTTRWRVPDLPAFVIIAAAGFFSIDAKLRLQILLAWGALLVGGAVLFYSVLS